MSTLTTFPRFPELPIEIRLKIWSYELSVSRTVTITCNRVAIIRGAPRSAKSWAADTPPPALLHVNRESRYEALAFYTPYFATVDKPSPVYLNFEQDKVRFADGVLPYLPCEEIGGIKTMVLKTQDCAYFGFYNMEILKKMKELENLEIYAEIGQVYTWWQVGDRYLNILVSDFEEAKETDPGWECPTVTIFDKDGEQVRFVEGGAKIPGWVEEPAHVLGEDDD